MTTAEHSTVVGTFADRTQAEHALDELQQVGFSNDQVGFSAGDEAEGEHKETQKQEAQFGNADTASWKDPNVKNPSIR